LKKRGLEIRPSYEVTVKRVVANANLLTSDSENKCGLDRLIEVSTDLYTFKKRLAYLTVFKMIIIAKVKGKIFQNRLWMLIY